MKVSFVTSGGKVRVEVEGKTQKDIFEQIAQFQEVFDNPTCGLCGSTNIKFVCRTVQYTDEKTGKVKDAKYYEMKCVDCGAVLEFGQLQDGEDLFPKRKDNYKTNGWKKKTFVSNDD